MLKSSWLCFFADTLCVYSRVEVSMTQATLQHEL